MNLLKRERREPEVRAGFLLANQFNLCSLYQAVRRNIYRHKTKSSNSATTKQAGSIKPTEHTTPAFGHRRIIRIEFNIKIAGMPGM